MKKRLNNRKLSRELGWKLERRFKTKPAIIGINGMLSPEAVHKF
jgi:hypothetical protein